jgi:hypothetical protein
MHSHSFIHHELRSEAAVRALSPPYFFFHALAHFLKTSLYRIFPPLW